MPLPGSNSTLPGEMPPPPPDSDASKCHLLGTTGIIVQMIMGFLVLASLVAKRQFEKRKRPWRIWTWDVGKQLAGQSVVHGLNLLISNVVADAAESNPCSLYFLNVLIDTTVGVLIFYVTLKGLTWFLTNRLGKEGFVSGQYGNPPRPLFWWRQLAPYLISMVFMKLLVVLPLTLPYISTGLLRFGHDVLDFLHPSIQIIFVMAIFPVIMNIVQFCIFDQIIKAGKDTEGSKGEDSDDAEGGGGAYQRVPTRDIESSPRSDRMRRRPSGTGTGLKRPSSRGRSGSGSEGRIQSGLSTPVPNSPLLEPTSHGSRVDYGSTSPSPALDAVRGDGAFWKNMLNGTKGPKPDSQSQLSISVPTSSSLHDSHLAVSTATGTTTRHDWRSGAPSPESFRPDESRTSDRYIPSIDLSHVSSETDTSNRFGHVSRVSEDMGREARKQLSPRTEGPPASFANGGMGLQDLPK